MTSSATQLSGRIQVVPGNTNGHDYSVADIHAHRELLADFLDKGLKKRDRLFGAGDFIDRGPESMGVIRLIRRINFEQKQNHLPPKIYLVRGNHEDCFILYCVTKREKEKTRKQYLDLKNAYEEKLKKEGFAATQSDRNNYEDARAKYHSAHLNHQGYYHFLKKYGPWALELTPEDQDEVEQFLLKLPHIIHVLGRYSFTALHADSPFTARQLKERIAASNYYLDSVDVDYVTTARMNDPDHPIVDTEAEPEDPIIACGHSICFGPRELSHHMNQDIGSYLCNALLLINHHTKECTLWGDHPNFEAVPGPMTPLEVQKRTQVFLTKKKLFDNLHELLDYLKNEPHSSWNKSKRPREHPLEKIISDFYSTFKEKFHTVDIVKEIGENILKVTDQLQQFPSYALNRFLREFPSPKNPGNSIFTEFSSSTVRVKRPRVLFSESTTPDSKTTTESARAAQLPQP